MIKRGKDFITNNTVEIMQCAVRPADKKEHKENGGRCES
jgi:hypothetical protein